MNLAQYFHDAAVESPDRPALFLESGDYTYGQLFEIVQGLRQALPRVQRIGLFAHKSEVAYAGVQAILAVGATYVPLNPIFPAHRNHKMMMLGGLTTLLVGAECAEALAGVLPLCSGPLEIYTYGAVEAIRNLVKAYPNVTLREVQPYTGNAPVPPSEPVDGIAYILFTSGSTGDPKGVCVTHANVVSYVKNFTEAFPISSDDRCSQTFDMTFDPSVHDMFVAWKSRASLVCIPTRLMLSPLQFAAEKGITVWFSVVSIPAMLASSKQIQDGALPKVRLSMLCAEKLTWNVLQLWKRIVPNAKHANIYGPTEVTISSVTFAIPDDFPESACHHGGIPIGYPYPTQPGEIRREDGSLCDKYEEGMLWLGGDQVTPGYLDPVKTAERFVPKDGQVWYRSGEILLLDDAGRIQYVGREDFQIKITGYRIELGEIEAALLRASGAEFAVADVARLRGEVDEIVCVLPTAVQSRKKEIREAVRLSLAPYMVPRVWLFQDELPLNSSGKVDRKALKADWAANVQLDT